MKLIFMNTLIYSIMISFINKNWFMMWLIMELNLYSFIPIIYSKKNVKIKSKIMINYFIIQCFSSMLLMFSLLNSMMMMNYLMNINYLIMMSSMMIKLGMYPFYLWMIKIMKNMNWMNCFYISTIQKFIPIYLFMNLMWNKMIMMILLINIINAIISTIGGLNSTLMKMIIAYSSMHHLSWMIISSILFEKLLMIYLIIYSLINFSLMKMLSKLNVNTIKKFNLMKMHYLNKMSLNINFLSLGGIPPFMGFLLKWMTNYLVKMSLTFQLTLMILMLTSILTFMYYLNIINTSIMIQTSILNKSLNTSKFKNKLSHIFMFMSMWMLSMNYILY